jgi:hypothetical protein
MHTHTHTYAANALAHTHTPCYTTGSGDVLNFVFQGAPLRKTGTRRDRFDMHTRTLGLRGGDVVGGG